MESGPYPCRCCGTIAEHPVVIELGNLPLGNSMPTEPQKSYDTFPLALDFCETCSLLQTRSKLPEDRVMTEILYFSSVSPYLLDYNEALASQLIELCGLNETTPVFEIGSNDGYFLRHFAERRIPVLGIEPVASSAELAERQYGVKTEVDLFTDALAERLKGEGKTAHLVVANYVLELVPDLNDFMKGLATVVRPDGYVLIEVPYARTMIERRRIDGIAHVRVSWFNLTSMAHLFRAHGFAVVDAQSSMFRGGTLKVLFKADPNAAASARATQLLQEERDIGATSVGYYREFAKRLGAIRQSLRDLLAAKKSEGKRLAVYGAGIKASTLVNFAGLGSDVVDYAVDTNEYRQGRYIPGVGLPVFPPSKLLAEMPDYTLLLALDYTDEVLAQQQEYRAKGGKFIIPAPEPHIV